MNKSVQARIKDECIFVFDREKECNKFMNFIKIGAYNNAKHILETRVEEIDERIEKINASYPYEFNDISENMSVVSHINALLGYITDLNLFNERKKPTRTIVRRSYRNRLKLIVQ